MNESVPTLFYLLLSTLGIVISLALLLAILTRRKNLMAKDYNPGNYRLAVPLDASEIEGFKPEKGVKVGVLNRSGKIQTQTVRLDAKGHGVANFNFSAPPGALS